MFSSQEMLLLGMAKQSKSLICPFIWLIEMHERVITKSKLEPFYDMTEYKYVYFTVHNKAFMVRGEHL